MAKKKTDPYAQQAQAASLVRYGPELSALTALLHAAETSYADRVRNAKSNRQFTVGAVDAAVPQVAQAYQGAQAAVQPAFAQGGGVEAQALQARLGESGALAQQQLAARRVSAVEGQGAAQQQALRDFRDDRGKIGDRSAALAQEIGAFTTQTSGELSAADASAQAESDKLAAQLGQSERNSIRSSGVDPDTGAPIPGGKLDPKTNAPKKNWATNEQQGAAADDLDTARGFAEKLKAVGVSRGDAAQALLVGQDAKEIPVFQTVKLANGGTKQEKVLWRVPTASCARPRRAHARCWCERPQRHHGEVADQEEAVRRGRSRRGHDELDAGAGDAGDGVRSGRDGEAVQRAGRSGTAQGRSVASPVAGDADRGAASDPESIARAGQGGEAADRAELSV
jgi:hypothetical protein